MHGRKKSLFQDPMAAYLTHACVSRAYVSGLLQYQMSQCLYLSPLVGCHLYATSRPGGSHLRMVISVGKRLLVYAWKHSSAWSAWCSAADDDITEEFQFIRVSAPLTVYLINAPELLHDELPHLDIRHILIEECPSSERLHS